jgi:hypothetical protein
LKLKTSANVCSVFYSFNNMKKYLNTSQERKMFLRILYPVLRLIA